MNTTETVQCPICGKHFRAMTNTHLKFHDMTIKEFRQAFPNMNIRSPQTKQLISCGLRKSWQNPESGFNSASRSQKISKAASHHRHSLETRLHLSRIRKGKPKSEEFKRRVAETQRGRKHSLEWRRHISEGHRRWWANPENAKRQQERRAVSRRNLQAARLKGETRFVRTSIERKLQDILELLGLDYEYQHNVAEINEKLDHAHIFDFAVPEQRLLIEADGCWWHCCPQCWPDWSRYEGDSRIEPEIVVKRDAACNQAVRDSGWTILRFWEHEINADLSAIKDRLEAACMDRTLI